MKETWKMIALLAIAIGGLLAYAFIPEQVAENIPLKQIGMDALTGKSEAELAEEEKADSMIKEPVDTAAQRVLIFGDSMSEYLGLRLADYTNKNGHKLTCITWVSSGTRNWAATDTLQHYIQRIKPTHVFVCLGSIPFALLTFVVLVDLTLLCYFKYTNFIIGDVVNEMFSTNFSLQSIALPVGISFYTFQAISYVVDTYKRKFDMEVTLLEYCFYLTFWSWFRTCGA